MTRRWAVQTTGTQRADSLHKFKWQAIARARELAANKHAGLVIKTLRGRVRAKDSHGRASGRAPG